MPGPILNFSPYCGVFLGLLTAIGLAMYGAMIHDQVHRLEIENGKDLREEVILRIGDISFSDNCDGDQAHFCKNPIATALICLGNSDRVCRMLKSAIRADGRFTLVDDHRYTVYRQLEAGLLKGPLSARKGYRPEESDPGYPWIEIVTEFDYHAPTGTLNYFQRSIYPRNVDLVAGSAGTGLTFNPGVSALTPYEAAGAFVHRIKLVPGS